MRNKALVGAALAAALAFLTAAEGMRNTAYQDSVGVWTICAGTTTGVKPGQKATQAQCWDMTTRDYRLAEKSVLRGIQVPLGPHQQTALTSFCYNVGANACEKSTLFRRVNAGECWNTYPEWLRWNKATIKGQKVALPGLTNRRKAEADLFMRDCP